MEFVTLRLVDTEKLVAKLKLRSESLDLQCELTGDGVAAVFRSDVIEARSCIATDAMLKFTNLGLSLLEAEWQNGLPVLLQSGKYFRQHAFLFTCDRESTTAEHNETKLQELVKWLVSHRLTLVAQTGSAAQPVNVFLVPPSAVRDDCALSAWNTSYLHCVFLRTLADISPVNQCITADNFRVTEATISRHRHELAERAALCNLRPNRALQSGVLRAFKSCFAWQRQEESQLRGTHLLGLLFSELKQLMDVDEEASSGVPDANTCQRTERCDNPVLLNHALHKRVDVTEFCELADASDVHKRLPLAVQVLLRTTDAYYDKSGERIPSAADEFLAKVGRTRLRHGAQVISFSQLPDSAAWRFATRVSASQSTSANRAQSSEQSVAKTSLQTQTEDKWARFTETLTRKIVLKLRMRSKSVDKNNAISCFRRSKLHATLVERFGEACVKTRIESALRRFDWRKVHASVDCNGNKAASLPSASPSQETATTRETRRKSACKQRSSESARLNESASRASRTSLGQAEDTRQLRHTAARKLERTRSSSSNSSKASNSRARAEATRIANELADRGQPVTYNAVKQLMNSRLRESISSQSMKKAMQAAGFASRRLSRKRQYVKVEMDESKLLLQRIVQVADELHASNAKLTHRSIVRKLDETFQTGRLHYLLVRNALIDNGYRLLPLAAGSDSRLYVKAAQDCSAMSDKDEQSHGATIRKQSRVLRSQRSAKSAKLKPSELRKAVQDAIRELRRSDTPVSTSTIMRVLKRRDIYLSFGYARRLLEITLEDL